MNSIPRPIPFRTTAVPVVLACAVILAAAFSGGCGSASTSLVAPTAQKCQISVSNFTGTFGPSGGSGSATIDAARECSWSATSQAAWISVASPASGTGGGTLTFSVAANQVPRARSGGITVNSQQLTVSQDAAPCRFAVAPTSQQLGAAGGTASTNVSATDGCSWTAASQAPWIQLATGGGSGNGSVAFTVGANSGPQRSGALVVAGQTVTVVQAAVAPTPPTPTPPGPTPPACQFSVSPSSLAFPAAGGQSSVQLTTTPGCPWNASASAAWLTLSPSRGTKSDTIAVTAAPNADGAPRTATISIADQVVQVTQDAGASVTVQLSGSVAGRRGDCPSLTFFVQDVPVVTTADTVFVNTPCNKVKNGQQVVVDGTQQPGQPVIATRVRTTN